jgi:hypothetical protein
MIENSSFVREEVGKLWPDLQDQAILLDKNFYISSLDEMVSYFKASKLSEMETIGEMWECDKYATAFFSEVSIKRYNLRMIKDLPEDKWAPIALSRVAYGNMFRGINLKHVVNLGLTEAGIYLFDLMPDANRYWKANPDNDNVQILVM